MLCFSLTSSYIQWNLRHCLLNGGSVLTTTQIWWSSVWLANEGKPIPLSKVQLWIVQLWTLSQVMVRLASLFLMYIFLWWLFLSQMYQDLPIIFQKSRTLKHMLQNTLNNRQREKQPVTRSHEGGFLTRHFRVWSGAERPVCDPLSLRLLVLYGVVKEGGDVFGEIRVQRIGSVRLGRAVSSSRI
jgi:hypothetical protein